MKILFWIDIMLAFQRLKFLALTLVICQYCIIEGPILKEEMTCIFVNLFVLRLEVNIGLEIDECLVLVCLYLTTF
jgi:hypothetical protein